MCLWMFGFIASAGRQCSQITHGLSNNISTNQKPISPAGQQYELKKQITILLILITLECGSSVCPGCELNLNCLIQFHIFLEDINDFVQSLKEMSCSVLEALVPLRENHTFGGPPAFTKLCFPDLVSFGSLL